MLSSRERRRPEHHQTLTSISFGIPVRNEGGSPAGMAGDAKSVNWRNSMRFMLNRRNRDPFNVMGIVMLIASANLRPRKRLSPVTRAKLRVFYRS
jgi:hypothetical protein